MRKLYIKVDGKTRIVHDSVLWLRACAEVLSSMGHEVTHVMSRRILYRDREELGHVCQLLDKVIHKTGGLTLTLEEGTQKHFLK